MEVLIVDITFNQRPVAHKIISSTLVRPDCLTSIVIVLKDSVMLKTRVGGGQC